MSADRHDPGRLSRRRFLFGLTVLCAAGTRATANPAPASSPLEINVGYGIFATPMATLGEVMRRDAVLQAAAGKRYRFQFHRYEKGADTVGDFLAGKLDASMPTDVAALDVLAKDKGLLLGYVRQSFSSVVAPRGWSVADLRGKRIGYAPGTSGHHALLQALASGGIKESDTQLLSMRANEMGAALLGGGIDAFAAWEPILSAFLRKYGDRYASLYRQNSPAYLMVSRELAMRQVEASRLLVAALHRACRWLARSRGNLQLAAQWTLAGMQEYAGRSADVGTKEIAALTRSDLLDVAGAPAIPAREVQLDSPLGRSFEFLRKAGRLPGDMEWGRVVAGIDYSVGRQVLGDTVGFRLNEFDYRP